nr:histidinol-phosphatase [Kordiimonas aquimaris]
MTKQLDDQMIEELKAFACQLADAAEKVSLLHFRKKVAVEDKGNPDWFDPVTVADRGAEEAIRALIDTHYPEHNIVGEEFGVKKTDSLFEWVLDPIDGTRAFISGLPTWGTLIALKYDGVPVIGVIDQPYLKERYLGWTTGATLNGEPISTRACEGLNNATISTTDADLFNANERPLFDDILGQSRLVRYGMDCYAYGIVAAGHMDAVIEAGLQPYDMMALIPVVRGAGGVAVNWNGDAPGADGRLIAAGDSRVAKQMLEVTRRLA